MAAFVFVFRGGAYATPSLSPTEIQAHLMKWRTWINELIASGHHKAENGVPLESGGRTVRGTAKTVSDGPYAESKDLVTGSMLIDAPSLDAATELARGCPVYEYSGSVEVRPVRSYV